jgi:hypothetical protein
MASLLSSRAGPQGVPAQGEVLGALKTSRKGKFESEFSQMKFTGLYFLHLRTLKFIHH